MFATGRALEIIKGTPYVIKTKCKIAATHAGLTVGGRWGNSSGIRRY